MVNEAVIDFALWVEGKQHEREIGPATKQPGKGKQWVPKYASIADILAEYGHTEPDAPVVPQDEIDALIAEMDAGTEPAF